MVIRHWSIVRGKCRFPECLLTVADFLPDHAQFSTDCCEGGAGSLKLFVLVGRRHLYANPCLTFRHNRVTEPHDIDPFLQKPLCHPGGE